jgi:hypothetical protein
MGDEGAGAVGGDTQFDAGFRESCVSPVEALRKGVCAAPVESGGSEYFQQSEGEVAVGGGFVDELAGAVVDVSVARLGARWLVGEVLEGAQ